MSFFSNPEVMRVILKKLIYLYLFSASVKVFKLR